MDKRLIYKAKITIDKVEAVIQDTVVNVEANFLVYMDKCQNLTYVLRKKNRHEIELEHLECTIEFPDVLQEVALSTCTLHECEMNTKIILEAIPVFYKSLLASGKCKILSDAIYYE